VEIEFLCPADGPILSSVRLRALRDSPEAFLATPDEEAALTPADWTARIMSATWTVAWDGDVVVGIACLTSQEAKASNTPKEWFIESVWVEPGYRRKGLVRRMVQKLEGQAREDGAERLQLWVLGTNDLAFDAYKKIDFYPPVPEVVQDSPKPRGDGFVKEHLMVKQLLG
jgi:ribosomal protein S18 acetylase RimI-like enzyme